MRRWNHLLVMTLKALMRETMYDTVNCVQNKRGKKVIPPGVEPGTLSVLDSRDNHYIMESPYTYPIY